MLFDEKEKASPLWVHFTKYFYKKQQVCGDFGVSYLKFFVFRPKKPGGVPFNQSCTTPEIATAVCALPRNDEEGQRARWESNDEEGQRARWESNDEGRGRARGKQ